MQNKSNRKVNYTLIRISSDIVYFLHFKTNKELNFHRCRQKHTEKTCTLKQNFNYFSKINRNIYMSHQYWEQAVRHVRGTWLLLFQCARVAFIRYFYILKATLCEYSQKVRQSPRGATCQVMSRGHRENLWCPVRKSVYPYDPTIAIAHSYIDCIRNYFPCRIRGR